MKFLKSILALSILVFASFAGKAQLLPNKKGTTAPANVTTLSNNIEVQGDNNSNLRQATPTKKPIAKNTASRKVKQPAVVNNKIAVTNKRQ